MELHPLRFPAVIDSTMLTSWDCPKKWEFAHGRRYGHEGKSIHLIAGAAYAKGLEVARLSYVQGADPETCLERGTEALLMEYGEAECPPDSAKTAERMVGALEFYFDQYPLETDPARVAIISGRPAVEWTFALPLPFSHPETGEPLLFTGRTDMICEFAGGLYAEDDKTTSQLGSSWSKQWELRGQFTGYGWAARELGIKLAGTLVRGVSILKTRYDTAQAIINQPDWKIDQWVEYRDHRLAQMISAYREGRFIPALGEKCNEYGGCPFKSVCTIPPAQRPNWLAVNFVENEWSPLNPA